MALGGGMLLDAQEELLPFALRSQGRFLSFPLTFQIRVALPVLCILIRLGLFEVSPQLRVTPLLLKDYQECHAQQYYQSQHVETPLPSKDP